jgi:hypothetical protein
MKVLFPVSHPGGFRRIRGRGGRCDSRAIPAVVTLHGLHSGKLSAAHHLRGSTEVIVSGAGGFQCAGEPLKDCIVH